MSDAAAVVQFEIPSVGGRYYPCRAILPDGRPLPGELDGIADRDWAMRIFEAFRVKISGKPVNAETVADWPEETIIAAAHQCLSRIMEKIKAGEVENLAHWLATKALKEWMDADEAQSLAGKFRKKQTIRVGPGLICVRGSMNREALQMRLEYIASDPRPEREKERKWLRRRLERSQ